MWTITRAYVLTMGVAFILAGIAGFLPILTVKDQTQTPNLLFDMNYGYLLGLFPVNLMHNLFHFSAGVIGLLSFRSEKSARQYCQAIGIILLAFAIMGILPSLSTTWGLMPLFGHDVWLHAVEATIAITLGFFWNAQLSKLQWKQIA